MPTPHPTGQVRFNTAKKRYEARMRYRDGARPWRMLPPGLTQAQAITMAQRLDGKAKLVDYDKAARRRNTGGDTVSEWFETWASDRVRRGLVSVADDRSRFAHHIEPVLGGLPMAAVVASDIEDVRDALDQKIISGELSWKTASNIWTVITSMFRDAKTSKSRTLRCRDDNPAVDIVAPERGEKKTKAYLYPSEFLRLVSCAKVARHWRQIYTLATYLYIRAGELEALDGEDIDLTHLSVHISKAIQADGTLGPPKSGRSRVVPIEPTLVPLLESLPRKGRVIYVPRKNDRAAILREHLARAGVKRWDLTADDSTRTPITFHDLRATGITWCAVREDSPIVLMRRAGHKNFQTTDGYIREAESVRGAFGTVFPELPAEISGQTSGHNGK